MPFNLLIIRHAESANNLLAESAEYESYVATRIFEPEITERGVKQAQALADHLSGSTQIEFARVASGNRYGYGITRLVASPMVRTLQTAWPTAQALGLPLEIWPEIFEQGGLFEGSPREPASLRTFPGHTRAQYMQLFPGVLVPPEIGEAGWWNKGYEEMEHCTARAGRVAEQLIQLAKEAAAQPSEPPTTLAMFSHGTFINQMLSRLLNLPHPLQSYIFHANTGITRIEFQADGFRVVRFLNRTQHLSAELLSR